MQKLGKYEVVGELGQGAMGVVYRVRDPIINRLVALKTINARFAEDPNLLQRFYREAQSAGGLQHPNIVTIYEMGDDQNTPYIVMELIDGESFEQIITRRAEIPLALKLSFALQTCRALDYAHKRGIIHRDIKPGNVMVNKEGVVKVVDFGIARALETSKTQTGMLIGTFAYMSPEQYKGEHADARSDIWALGVLLYELLFYERPFTGRTASNLMHSICTQEPRMLRDPSLDLPPEVAGILSKSLQKSPECRFQSMEDLIFEFEPICQKVQAQSSADLVVRGRTNVENEHFVQARDMFRQALRIDSTNSEARTQLEQINARLTQGADARLAAVPPDGSRTLVAAAFQKEGVSGKPVADQSEIEGGKERDERLRLLDGMQRARHLWTQQNYTECIRLLTSLGKEFPNENEISRLLEIVREDKAVRELEQRTSLALSAQTEVISPSLQAARLEMKIERPTATAMSPSANAPVAAAFLTQVPADFAGAGLNAALAPAQSLKAVAAPSIEAADHPRTVEPPRLSSAGRRFVYMATGGLIVVAILFASAAYVPRRVKTDASSVVGGPSRAQRISEAPVPGAQNADRPSSVFSPNASSSPTPSAGGSNSNPPASAQFKPRTNAEVRNQQSAFRQNPNSNATPSAPTTEPPPHTDAVTLPAAVPSTRADGGPIGETLKAQAASNDADLEEAERELDQLRSRASAISQSLDILRRQQNAQGYGLRGDMGASENRMQANLARAQSALQQKDTASTKKYLNIAEAEVEKLEQFLGR